MAGPGQSKRKRGRRQPVDATDHITGPRKELRARIVSFLPFRKAGRLSSLSRPWRRIHGHMPVVRLRLGDILLLTDEEDGPLGILDEDALAGLEAAASLPRRGRGVRILQNGRPPYLLQPEKLGMRRHADRIMALADACEIFVGVPWPYSMRASRVAWALDLHLSARDLGVNAFHHLAPTIAGPGASALEDLRLVSANGRASGPRGP